jgi:hypothetical protein
MIGLRPLDCQAARGALDVGRSRSSGHDPAAVGLEHLAGEIVGGLSGEEDCAVGDIFHLSEMAHGSSPIRCVRHSGVMTARLMSVSMPPGAIALTVTPWGPNCGPLRNAPLCHDTGVLDEDVESPEARQHAVHHRLRTRAPDRSVIR